MLEIRIPEDGYITTGGPGGLLLGGMHFPDDRCYHMEFFIVARDNSQSAWACHYQSIWEQDAGVFAPLKAGGDVVEVWTNPGTLDWGVALEVDVNGDLQLRAYGTQGSVDTRWGFWAVLRPVTAPSTPPEGH
jgi:hypothetical protein